MMRTKQCHACGKKKPILLFAHDRTVPDGRSRTCKRCKVVETKQWRRKTLGMGVGKFMGPDWHSLRKIRD